MNQKFKSMIFQWPTKDQTCTKGIESNLYPPWTTTKKHTYRHVHAHEHHHRHEVHPHDLGEEQHDDVGTLWTWNPDEKFGHC